MFCTSCGTAIPADAKFCPKCGKPVVAAAPAPAPSAGSPAAPTPVAQPAAVPGAFDLSDGKFQAIMAFVVVGVVLAIFGLIGLSNAGAGGMIAFALMDIGLAVYAAWCCQLIRTGKLNDARMGAAAIAIALVIIGVLVMIIAGSAAIVSLIICLALAGLMAFAYMRIGKLMAGV